MMMLAQPIIPINAPPRPSAAGVYGGHVRVAGQLAHDARFAFTTAQPPHLLMQLELQPALGLRYLAEVDLGADPADHHRAQAMQPALRRGAIVSVAAQALQLRTDHSHAALRMVRAHSVIVLSQPTAAAVTTTTTTAPSAPVPQEA